MIPISDLRKGNLIKTEYGVLPVHAIVFNSVQVKGKDERILWAKEVEGVKLNEIELLNFGFEIQENKSFVQKQWVNNAKMRIVKYRGSFQWCPNIWSRINLDFAHELQNVFYWIN